MPESAEFHPETTRREFTKQAENFERPGSIFRDREILEWIGERVPVSSTDLVLDVAGGSGQLGRYLAETASFAVVADLTPEMTRSSTSSPAASPSTTSMIRCSRRGRWGASAGPAGWSPRST
jgi:hypothetical protein